MSDVVRAFQEFGDAVAAGIEQSQRDLADRFARYVGSPVKEIAWSGWSNGDAGLMVTLANGRSLYARAPGKLDALADFEDALRVFVREEDDGTISVRPGDGSSNSILLSGAFGKTWHGYIEHGEWSKS
jgi:hypothetical protein